MFRKPCTRLEPFKFVDLITPYYFSGFNTNYIFLQMFTFSPKQFILKEIEKKLEHFGIYIFQNESSK
jgi:hypothetical protein